jgi:hypothetical protein
MGGAPNRQVICGADPGLVHIPGPYVMMMIITPAGPAYPFLRHKMTFLLIGQIARAEPLHSGFSLVFYLFSSSLGDLR